MAARLRHQGFGLPMTLGFGGDLSALRAELEALLSGRVRTAPLDALRECPLEVLDLTGNEIGVLLGHWQWTQYRKKTKGEDGGPGAAMLASTVSSKMPLTKCRGVCGALKILIRELWQ